MKKYSIYRPLGKPITIKADYITIAPAGNILFYLIEKGNLRDRMIAIYPASSTVTEI